MFERKPVAEPGGKRLSDVGLVMPRSTSEAGSKISWCTPPPKAGKKRAFTGICEEELNDFVAHVVAEGCRHSGAAVWTDPKGKREVTALGLGGGAHGMRGYWLRALLCT